jgi:hypothetical protein
MKLSKLRDEALGTDGHVAVVEPLSVQLDQAGHDPGVMLVRNAGERNDRRAAAGLPAPGDGRAPPRLDEWH